MRLSHSEMAAAAIPAHGRWPKNVCLNDRRSTHDRIKADAVGRNFVRCGPVGYKPGMGATRPGRRRQSHPSRDRAWRSIPTRCRRTIRRAPSWKTPIALLRQRAAPISAPRVTTRPIRRRPIRWSSSPIPARRWWRAMILYASWKPTRCRRRAEAPMMRHGQKLIEKARAFAEAGDRALAYEKQQAR